MAARVLALAGFVLLPTCASIRIRGNAVPTHSAYELVRVDEVEEQGTNFTLYRHKKTGTEVLSGVNDDDNKVFGIAFRTPIHDSTGVAHILEHSVLCGSDKYPVKEPFVHLMRSSMQTYLNALTYPERTLYPVASTNLKDFYNLMDVYMDAVFHPRAIHDPMILQQEGWHYEIKSAEDPLTYKGIVFNEMKGVYGSPDSRMQKATQRNLFPNTTYRFNSGGDPKEITDLTFEGFKAFYNAHYHPANARVFFYGNDPVEERLARLDEYLKEYSPPAEHLVENTRVATQKLWSAPRRAEVGFPVAADEKKADAKHILAVEWLLNEEAIPPMENFALSLVSHLLLGSYSAPMHKALTDSALGESVTGGGFSDSLKQSTFSVGLKGIAAGDVAKAEGLIMEILQQTVSKGFTKEAVEASLNTIEFSMRELSSASATRGITFLTAAMKHWIFERDPLTDLRFEEPLREVRSQLAKPNQRYLEGLVQQYLLDNQHRLVVEGVPDPTLGEKEEADEKARLQSAREGMTTSDLQKLVETAKDLAVAQEAPDPPSAVATLPRLSLSDLDRKAKDLDITIGQLHNSTYLTHVAATNGVVYFDVGFDASGLSLEDVPLLPLFEHLLTTTGTSKMDRTSFEQRMNTYTGGISSSSMNGLRTPTDGKVGNLNDIVYHVAVHGKASASHMTELLDLMHAALTDAKLDSQDRAVEFLKSTKAGLEGAFRSSGSSYAQMRIMARRSLAGYVDEITGGLSYFNTVEKLLHTAESDWPSLVSRLELMRGLLFDRQSAIVNVAADAKSLKAVSPAIDAFVLSLPVRSNSVEAARSPTLQDAKSGEVTLRLTSSEEGFVVPTQVNFVAKGGGLIQRGDRVTGAFQVVVRYISNSYLWDKVRVMGGAYGSSCSISPVSGTFLCSSYRDPNLENTLDIYDEIASYLEGLQLDKEAVEQLIIGAVADLDHPLAPASQGSVSLNRYLTGQTFESRQRWRDEMFATSPDDFKAFAAKMRASASDFHACVFGNADSFTKANAALVEQRRLHLTDVL